jgi:hypothetical protein
VLTHESNIGESPPGREKVVYRSLWFDPSERINMREEIQTY